MLSQRVKYLNIDGTRYTLLITENAEDKMHFLVKEPTPQISSIIGEGFSIVKKTNQIVCKLNRKDYDKKLKELKGLLSKISFMSKLVDETAKEIIEEEQGKKEDVNTYSSDTNDTESKRNNDSGRSGKNKSNKKD